MDTVAIIVDDDEKLQSLLEEFLISYGIQVIPLLDGSRVIETIRSEQPDVVILDNILPDTDGLELLKEIRKEFTTPVIMLSIRAADTDRILGLELGADDYLPKPHNPMELLARIKAVLRRSAPKSPVKKTGSPLKGVEIGAILAVGSLRLDRSRYSIGFEDKTVALSTTEFKIMEILMAQPGQAMSREDLLTCLHGHETVGYDRTIDLHICNLRNKITSLLADRNCIKTVWGVGYMFVEIQ